MPRRRGRHQSAAGGWRGARLLLGGLREERRARDAMPAACENVVSDIHCVVTDPNKPLVWLRGEVKSPPFGAAARIEAGTLLRRLQRGEALSLPRSRPMPVIAPRCHELRVVDDTRTWRVVYRTDPDAIVIADVFAKTTRTTPARIIDTCRRRLRAYDDAAR